MLFNQILKEKVNSLIDDLGIQKIVVDILKDNTAEIEDINIVQLEKGEDTDGALIAPSYRNKGYEAMKRSRLGLRTPKGVPNLRLTGETHDSIKANVSNTEIMFTMKDRHNLETKYGEVKGLNERGQTDLKQDIIIPETQEEILNKLR